MKTFYEGREPKPARKLHTYLRPDWKYKLLESAVLIVLFGLLGYVWSGWVLENKPPPIDRKFEKRWYDRVQPR